jgi:hypothetical protein
VGAATGSGIFAGKAHEQTILPHPSVSRDPATLGYVARLRPATQFFAVAYIVGLAGSALVIRTRPRLPVLATFGAMAAGEPAQAGG